MNWRTIFAITLTYEQIGSSIKNEKLILIKNRIDSYSRESMISFCQASTPSVLSRLAVISKVIVFISLVLAIVLSFVGLNPIIPFSIFITSLFTNFAMISPNRHWKALKKGMINFSKLLLLSTLGFSLMYINDKESTELLFTTFKHLILQSAIPLAYVLHTSPETALIVTIIIVLILLLGISGIYALLRMSFLVLITALKTTCRACLWMNKTSPISFVFFFSTLIWEKE